jgi:hypothetical protein
MDLSHSVTSATQTAQQVASGLSAHPWIVHVVVGLIFALGLVLSFMGRRVARGGFVTVGFLAGAVAGHLAPPALHLGGEPLATVVVLATLGAIFGWLSFRVFVASALGVVISVAAMLGVAAWFSVSPPKFDKSMFDPSEMLSPAPGQSDGENAAPADDDASRRVERALDDVQRMLDAARAEQEAARAGEAGPGTARSVVIDEAAQRSRDLMQSLAAKLAERFSTFWNDELTPAARFGLTMASIGGYLVGLVLGFLLPSKASAVTTAIVGPAVWIPAGVYLMHAMNLGIAASLPREPGFWLALWGGAAVVGLTVQLVTGRRKKPKKDE